jgi:DNA-binding beta-propeller fold protein YncE
VAFRVSNDNLQPKSIVHSGNGLFFAQNMMYRHNVSVFNREGKVVATVNDKVDLATFGVLLDDDRASMVKGSPVEVAFSPDASKAYVSNYKMYGNGWNPVADDSCQGRNWDPSYVYRISTTSFVIDQVIEVGAVPKFLAVSPDNKFVVVSNFCSQDVSIIDIARGLEVQRVLVGSHPRGIAITNDSSTAYVSVMGGGNVIAINLKDFTTRTLSSAGYTPRHLVLSPDNSVLYITNNKSGTVHRYRAAHNGDVGRRSKLVRRQLPRRSVEQDPHFRHEGDSDDCHGRSTNWRYVRCRDATGVGCQLFGQPFCVRRPLDGCVL